MTAQAAVATPNRLATETGALLLRQGGSAVDAAIGASASLAVCYPHMTSLGGDMLALIWPYGSSQPLGYNASGAAGAAATWQAIAAQGHQFMPQRGADSITVPGAVDGWDAIWRRFGKLDWKSLLDPAAALAADGFAASDGLCLSVAEMAPMLKQEPTLRRLLLPRSRPIRPGELVCQPELAASLRRLASAGGRDLYEGRLATRIGSFLDSIGGIIDSADLLRHRGQWVDPVLVDFRGHTVFTMPPNSQGLALLALLGRLEQTSWPGSSADRVDDLDAYGRAWSEVSRLRSQHIADPRFHPCSLVDFDRSAGGRSEQPMPAGDTVCICTTDSSGTMVCLIQSLCSAFGSGLVAGDTGILMHNRGSFFRLDPAHPNVLQGGKRPFHTLMPTMVELVSGARLAIGTMGSSGQPQIVSQVLGRIFEQGLGPQEAIAAPRCIFDQGQGPEPSWLAQVEQTEASDVGDGLRQRGWQVVSLASHDHAFGHAQAILTGSDGRAVAGFDPRSDGSAEIL